MDTLKKILQRKRKFYFLAVCFLILESATAQNSMGIGTDTPNPNAVLELVSPGNNQGLLVPRITAAERTAMSLTTTDNGLLVFDMDSARFYFWADPSWMEVSNKSGLAGEVEVTPSGNLVSTDVQAALEELQTKLDTTNSSPWAISGADLNYSAGNVGIGTVSPQANLQVGDQLGLFHFENAGFPVNGEVIADNLYVLGDSLYNIADGPTAFIFFDSGAIEFLHGDPLLAGQNVLSVGQISTSLRLEPSRHAEFQGAVEIGQIQDSSAISSGLMAFDLGEFWGFNGVDWIQFGGFSLPINEIVTDGGSSPFYVQNDGGGGVARFEVNNTSAFGNALEVQTNSNELNTAGIVVNNDGLGSGISVDLTNTGNTNNAITGNTFGSDGSAGYFTIDNATNNSAALMGIVNAGTGNVIEAINNGEGVTGRFTNNNTANGSIAFVVQNDGANSAALFTNSALASTAAVEIINNGTGSGLTIQNPGGTTSFGDAASLGGGQINRVTNVGVDTTLTASDYLVYLSASTVTVTIPDGLPLGTTYVITIGNGQSGGSVAFNSDTLIGGITAPIPLSSDVGTIRTVTLTKVTGTAWAIVSQVNNP